MIYRVPITSASETIGTLFKYGKSPDVSLHRPGLNVGTYELRVVREEVPRGENESPSVEIYVEVWKP